MKNHSIKNIIYFILFTCCLELLSISYHYTRKNTVFSQTILVLVEFTEMKSSNSIKNSYA